MPSAKSACSNCFLFHASSRTTALSAAAAYAVLSTGFTVSVVANGSLTEAVVGVELGPLNPPNEDIGVEAPPNAPGLPPKAGVEFPPPNGVELEVDEGWPNADGDPKVDVFVL